MNDQIKPSELYSRARESLGSGLAEWDQAAAKIGQVEGPDLANQAGSDALRMVCTENHLSADPNRAEPSLMKLLLACLASVRWPREPSNFARTYEAVMRSFALRGSRIRSSPTTLYRYCNGPGLLRAVSTVLESTSPNLARRLEQLIGDAANGGSGVSSDRVMEFITSPEVWSVLPRKHVPLSLGKSTFVTFDRSQGANRQSSAWVHSALALRKPRDDCFIESRYTPDPVEPLHFPTVADAGWSRHFYSAEAEAPHGWTRPHDASLPPQPEAVHRSAGLAVLDAPSDLRLLPP